MPRNKFEEKIYKQLKKRKAKFKYECRRIPYIIAGHYIPDFSIVTKSGTILVETKGYFRPEAKRKMVAVKKCNPGIDIRIVFYADTKSNRRWAERYGFKYAIGEIPEEWLNE